jgi:hypothetical protein
MAWTYHQKTGELLHDGELLGIGYSGFGEGFDNPDMQNVSNVGPVPQGNWTIGKPYTHIHLGPLTMNLTPNEGTNTFGRSAFRMHGDNSEVNHTASDGCIVINKLVRIEVTKDVLTGDNQLEIVV